MPIRKPGTPWVTGHIPEECIAEVLYAQHRWDLLSITGNLTISATNKPDDSQKFTLHLATLSGSAPGWADHFTNTGTNA